MVHPEIFFQELDVGLMDYAECLKLQQKTHEECVRTCSGHTVIYVEHPPVLTLGLNADAGFIVWSSEQLQKEGVQVVRTDRGGEVTAHMPGQLVVYPILHLTQLNLGPKKYVQLLEDVVLQTLKAFSIEGRRDEKFPGVWVGSNKICAVGIRIKDRVSMHGIALNICNDLSLFERIVPCGISSARGVTSMARHLGFAVEVGAVQREFSRLFAEVFCPKRAQNV